MPSFDVMNIDKTKKQKVKAALLVDSNYTKQWMASALQFAMDRNLEIALILYCTNSSPKRKPLAHAFYYLLNIFVMNGPEEQMVSISQIGLSGKPTHRFRSIYDGNWQKFPESISAEIAKENCEVVIKLGMGLLRNPDDCGAKYGVLSFHLGDPSEYRGRPSGFYEILHKRDTMGMMVQRLNNTLDAGQVLAFGRSRVFPFSYRKTLALARKNSIFLLHKAITSLQESDSVKIPSSGFNYRLPSNLLVLKFIFRIFLSKIKRLYYGLFWEKAWCIVKKPLSKDIILKGGDLDASGEIRCPNHLFYADGFFLPDGSVVAEAMRQDYAKGEIVRISENGAPFSLSDASLCHWSYPCTFNLNQSDYLLPEVAEWSAPFVLKIDLNGMFREKTFLKGLEDTRLVDPTFLHYNGIHYIFASKPGVEADQLFLWYSEASLEGPYKEHPMSPIVINPACARMGGHLVFLNQKLYRLGQNNVSDYGNGLRICEVIKLDINSYQERIITSIGMKNSKGPHTLNFSETSQVYDFYKNQFSFFAWYRRLKSKFILKINRVPKIESVSVTKNF
jgi:hypothetical protein